jgi:flavin-dependent dehydrogenase
MIVTGGGVTVTGRYPGGLTGRAITRAVFDAKLLEAAATAGVDIHEGTFVTGACFSSDSVVTGVRVSRRGGTRSVVRAPITIAADGRHSTLAFNLGLSRHPGRPRRWAVGAYFTDVDEVGTLGEMHIRDGHYIGVAQVPGGVVNACLVTADRNRLRDPDGALRDAIANDPILQKRFARARRDAPVMVLGPLAVRAGAAGMPGLLLAGDAAGFVDPMTGDGLRFAMRGAELAAHAALGGLAGSPREAYLVLARWRREFSRKHAFNRTLRALVGSPRAVRFASAGARMAPAALRYVIDIAGDVSAA